MDDETQSLAPSKTRRIPQRGALPSSKEALELAEPYKIPEQAEGKFEASIDDATEQGASRTAFLVLRSEKDHD